jgi:hypothetical protein
MLSQTAPRADLFISAKTATAIPARHPLVRGAMVQAPLDPQVRALEFVSTATVGSAQVALKAIVVARDDGGFHFDAPDDPHGRSLQRQGRPCDRMFTGKPAPADLEKSRSASNATRTTVHRSSKRSKARGPSTWHGSTNWSVRAAKRAR